VLNYVSVSQGRLLHTLPVPYAYMSVIELICQLGLSVTQLGLSAIEHVSKLDMSATDPVCQAGLAAIEPLEAIYCVDLSTGSAHY
jgi:hypothetical protein